MVVGTCFSQGKMKICEYLDNSAGSDAHDMVHPQGVREAGQILISSAQANLRRHGNATISNRSL